jgi:hypothetical protein
MTVLAIALVVSLSQSQEPKRGKDMKRERFNPAPLDDEWDKWFVGQWEGFGESEAGKGKGVERVEMALNGQFRIHRGEAVIAEMTPEQKQYLGKNMGATDEEIERFVRLPYQALEIYTIDQRTGEVVGYLFDSLRCMAQGRGKREGNRETVEWQWSNGHKSTRITERAGPDKAVVIQRTPMRDGIPLEEKGEMTRRK